MKRFYVILAFFICLFNMKVFASDQAVEFREYGKGKFIYCNNPEKLGREDLADTGNENPTLLMRSDNLGPDQYSMYIFHINNTSLDNEENIPMEPGFDIELDVRFWTEAGAKVKLTNVAFEVPIRELVDDIKFVETWATYLQIPIQEISTDETYIPIKFDPVEFEISGGEEAWLSTYIQNYCPIPYRKTVNIIADFEVVEGTVNTDIAAMRSYNVIRDRSNFDPNAHRGKYNPENQYKGIANTLPIVIADLAFESNNKTITEQPIPVTIYNQYLHYGKKVTEWMTNINPQADENARYSAAESDMLVLEYYDESKLTYYDKSIPEDQRNSTWIFDVFHSDTITGEPNYLLSPSNIDIEKACNLANYGVRVQYHVTATNTDSVGKSLDYYISTKANNIVYAYDAGHESEHQYALYKDVTDTNDPVLMHSVWLEPGETKNVIIENIVTTDSPGGVVNSFMWSKEKKENKVVEGNVFREPEVFENSPYLDQPMGAFAKKLFDSNLNNYDIIPVGDKYFVRWNAFDGMLRPIGRYIVGFYMKVHIFDQNFELIMTKELGDLVEKTDFNNLVVQLEDKLLDLTVPPENLNGRIYVPLQDIFEAMGAVVDWNSGSETATISIGEQIIILKAGGETAYVNGKTITIDTPVQIVESTVMVPLRFFSEELGYLVHWESEINWITLTQKED